MVKDRLIRPVTEADVLEDHLSDAAAVERARVSGLLDLEGLLHQFTDALHGRQAALDLRESFRQLPQGIEQSLGVEDEGGEDAQTHRSVGDHPAAERQDEGHRSERHPFQEGGDAAVEEDGAVDGPAVGKTRFQEAPAVDLLAAEHLHHLQTLQVLLEVGIEFGKLFPFAVVGHAVAALQPENHHGHGNLGDQQQQTDPPFDQQHRDGDDHKTDQIAEHADGTAAEHLGEGIHITGESGEQLAHLHGVVKPQRQRQRVLEQIVSDAGGETLPNRLDVEGLQPQQPQTQQHSAEQQPDDDPHRLLGGAIREPRQARFAAKHTDRLADQQRLDRPRQSDGQQQQHGEHQSAPVMSQVSPEAANPLPVPDDIHQAMAPTGCARRMASTMAPSSPVSRRRDRGWPTRRAVDWNRSSIATSPLSRRVRPVATRSTIASDMPVIGPSSTEPFRCTSSTGRSRASKNARAQWVNLLATRQWGGRSAARV